MNMNKIANRKSEIGNSRGFTLIELLVVIAIIGVLAAFTLPVLRSVKRQQYIRTANAELGQLETALENFKAKYGTYPPDNQNSANLSVTPPYDPALFNQLYYELSGTTISGGNFVTLDGSSTIAIGDVPKAYGVGGFVNCTQGGGEDGKVAQNFISGLSARELNYYVTNNSVQTTAIITSVGGPDDIYKPLGASGINPFRYIYPGTHNLGSYDLWVQLVINGQTNLVCNWSRQVQINSPLP
jgi:prepilin-type N-terminal cleavage/methylation domain-containing protein